MTFVIDFRLGSKSTSDYAYTQKQSSKDVLKNWKVLICTFKIKAKLLVQNWDNVRFW